MDQSFRDKYKVAGFTPGVDTRYYGQKATEAPKPNFFGNVAKSAGTIASGVGSAIYNAAFQAPQQLGEHLANYAQSGGEINSINSSQQALTQAQAHITRAYKDGKLSKDQYKTALKGLGSSFSKLGEQASNISKGLPGTVQIGKEAVQTGATIVTLAAGLPGASAPLFGTAALAETEGATGAAAALTKARLGIQSTLKAGESTLGPAGKLIRNAAITQPTVEAPFSIGEKLKQGNYAGAAGEVALASVPTALGAASALLKKAAPSIKRAFTGKAGVLDVALGNRVIKYAAEHPEDAQRLKRMELFTLNQPAVKQGASPGEFLANHLVSIGVNPGKKSIPQLLDAFDVYATKVEEVAKLVKAGKLPRAAVVSADFTKVVPMLQKALKDTENLGIVERGQIALETMQKAGITNPTVISKLLEPASRGQLAALEDVAQKQIIKKLGGGFIATGGPKLRATLPSLAASTGELTTGKAANPVLGAAYKALEKAGLSPKAVPSSVVRGKLIDNLDQQLANKGIDTPAKQVLNALNSIQKRGIFDPRSLTVNEARSALAGIPGSDPKAILSAVRQAYAKLPVEVSGLGGKVMNEALAKLPALSKYLRVQQLGRFDLNPFFAVKQDIKGSAVALAEGAKFSNILKSSPETEQALTKAGLFQKGFTGNDENIASLFGSGGKEFIRHNQQKILTGLADSIAESHGTTVKAILEEAGPLADQMKHALNLTVGYGKGGYLNSPLAKSLNLLIFPSRFDTKIALEAGKAFNKMNIVSQMAVVRDLGKAGEYLNSPEGEQWQKDNSELLGVIKYFTPIGQLGHVFDLLSGHGGHVSDLGEIGGLPFGVITQILEHQGVNLGAAGSSQYLNPKTGEPVPDKIPTTTKARFQQGLTDLISSLFSYPGRTAGLQSKTSLIQGVVPQLAPAKEETKSSLKGGKSVPTTSTAIPLASQSINQPTLPSVKVPSLRPTFSAPRAKKRAIRPGVAF